ncbi:MAG: PASTA domain-containing protein [Clostridia bacterium]|nr:PASTA domain-containing protein [Clostridia bacterium]
MKFNFFKRKKQETKLGLTIFRNDASDSFPAPYRGVQVYEDESDRFGQFNEDAFAGENYEIKRKRKKISPPKTPPSFFAGIFCGALSILIAGGAIAFFTLFSKSGGIYKEVTVPSLISLDQSEAISKLRNDYDCFDYTIEYKSNPLATEGTVISQAPKPSTVRKLYGINGRVTIKLTVTKSSEPITLPNITGLSARDVALELQNAGVNVYIAEVYSDSVKVGKIISASHSEGSKLKKNDSIYITASLGKSVRYIDAPSLVGLSESAAIALLKKEDLKIGKIIYKASALPLGTVIEQSVDSGSSLQSGDKINLTVSSGTVKVE